MNLKKQVTLNIINIIVFFIVASIAGTSSFITYNIQNSISDFKTHLEQQWREQARRTLQDKLYQLDKEVENDNINIYDNQSIAKWSNLYFSGVRNGGNTSDGFIIELGSEEFIDEQSLDCSIETLNNNDNNNNNSNNKRYMKDEAKIHKDPKQAEIILDEMRLGYSTMSNDNFWWNFDGEKEWLEWVVYPPKNGVDGEPLTIAGIKNPNYRKFIIVLGTQSDEIFKPYEKYLNKQKNIIHTLKILSVASLMAGVVFMLILIFKE